VISKNAEAAHIKVERPPNPVKVKVRNYQVWILNISTISDLTPAKAAAILVGEMVTEVSNDVLKHGLLSELSHNFQTNLNGMEKNKSNNFYSEL